MVGIRRILCPVDFSETSRHALAYAVLLAGRCDAELVLLHVLEEVPLLTAYGTMPQVEMVGEVERTERRELDEMLAGIQGVRARAELVTGHSYKAILRYAAAQQADLIVMGTHGRKGLDRAVFGSVTERVIRRATCPVLIVRHPEGKREE